MALSSNKSSAPAAGRGKIRAIMALVLVAVGATLIAFHGPYQAMELGDLWRALVGTTLVLAAVPLAGPWIERKFRRV